MIQREICLFPEDEDVLREECERIPEDKVSDYSGLVEDMIDLVEEYQALGLAAPQIGVSKAITTINPQQSDPFVLINPEITHHQGSISSEEGCLSFPGLTIEVERSAAIQYEALDKEGERIEDDVHGFLSTVIQHEIDHLQGTLFIDHLGETEKRMRMKEYRKIRKKMKRNSIDPFKVLRE